eukprot:3860962-Pleurochrysis_carterae.AAC.1
MDLDGDADDRQHGFNVVGGSGVDDGSWMLNKGPTVTRYVTARPAAAAAAPKPTSRPISRECASLTQPPPQIHSLHVLSCVNNVSFCLDGPSLFLMGRMFLGKSFRSYIVIIISPGFRALQLHFTIPAVIPNAPQCIILGLVPLPDAGTPASTFSQA